MNTLDVIAARRSYRSYTADDVPVPYIGKIIDAAYQGGGPIEMRIYTVRDKRQKEALGGPACIAAAPVVLVFCAGPGMLRQATMACARAVLAATALSLASVWVGGFRPDRVRRTVKAPADMEPIALVPIGYRAGPEKAPGRRRRLEDLVHYA